MKKKRYDLLLLLKKIKKGKFTSILSALNSEKSKIDNVNDSLKKMLSSSSFSEGEVFSSASMQQISNFRKNIAEKMEISRNRKNHLSKEIKNNLNQINIINKQKDVIENKKRQITTFENNIRDLKNDLNFKRKTL